MPNTENKRTDTGIDDYRYLLTQRHSGFEQLYTELKSFCRYLEQSPGVIDTEAIDILIQVIESPTHLKQKQVYFLFRQAAEILIFIIRNADFTTAKYAISHLQNIIIQSNGKKQRALSEVIGKLPITVCGPTLNAMPDSDPIPIRFSQLRIRIGSVKESTAQWHGRTLKFSCKDNTVLCLKFAKSKADIPSLAKEAQWLNYLRKLFKKGSFACHVPRLVSVQQRNIVDITDMAQKGFLDNVKQNYRYALIFKTIEAYYHYPNEFPVSTYKKKQIIEIFEKNAQLLGYLASKGIIHTALIPLFHNRVQQQRREDNGLYLWEHGGRLDQWLSSCKFPNFAASGLRDFEHFITLQNSKKIHHFIGEHILGFILTIGSFFRNREPDRKGWDDNGKPLDLRSLFNAPFFRLMLEKTITAYCTALTGTSCHLINRMDLSDLALKLINVMGIDHDMEERFRVEDQLSMNEDEFNHFLVSRGILARPHHYVRGEQDITFMSGPHLGGFNQPISIPELTQFLFCLSSISIAERYLNENALKGRLN